jgi:hypothetical protein
MNRFMVGMALALLLVGMDPLAGQARARVEYLNGRIGVGVAIGSLPVRVSPQSRTARGWVAADWGPVRMTVVSRRPSFAHGTLKKNDLRHLLGKETLKRLERHAKEMGLKGPISGRWFPLGRATMLLEVSVRGVPVAELHDYGNDGFIDRVFLTQVHRTARYEERGDLYRYGLRPWPW